MQSMQKSLVRLFAVALVITISGKANPQSQQNLPAPRAQPPRPAVSPVQTPRPVQAQAQPVAATSDAPQSTTATYADWVVQCETRAGSPPEKLCDMAQVTQLQGKNVPFSRVAIARPMRGQPIRLVLQVPVNVSFATSVRIQIGDSDTGVTAPFARCVPVGCFAEFELKDDLLRKFRAASGVGKLSFADAGGHDIAVPLAFNGFVQAFDALARE